MLGEWQIKIYKNNRFLRKILKNKMSRNQAG